MRKKRKAKTGKGVNIVLLIILVPMLGTLLGYAISQKVLIPYLVEKEDAVQGTAAADETPKGDAVPAEADQSKPVVAYQRMIDIEGMSIYCVQVGAFSSRDNAERMLEELKDKGFAGSVRKDKMYKVYSLYAFSENAARKQLDRVKEIYSDAHISTISYPSIGISYPDSSSREVEELWKQLTDTRRIIMDAMDRAASGESIKDIVTEHITQIKQYRENLEKQNMPPALAEYKDETIKMYDSILATYSRPGNKSDVQLAVDIVSIYMSFIERISQMV
ncbi:MAG: hypothetical protein HPY66_0757 [Firmicutes bacterium]|nr:hypothetical protein [Bacillota bacterium]